MRTAFAGPRSNFVLLKTAAILIMARSQVQAGSNVRKKHHQTRSEQATCKLRSKRKNMRWRKEI